MKKAYVALTSFGMFAVDENEKIIAHEFSDSIMNDEAQKSFVSRLKDYDVVMRRLPNSRAIALSISGQSNEEVNARLHKMCLDLSKSFLHGAIGMDKFIIQAYNAYSDMTRIEASMYERLQEWFTLHYPECKLQQKKLADAVVSFGRRENFSNFKFSTGVEIKDADMEAVMGFARSILSVAENRKAMEKYLKERITEIMPNFSSIIDPLLAARFLSLAGSLEKLSRMTSSTIQLLGAEKALFRHLKNNRDRSPKFGILFLSSVIQNSPPDRRGKVARLLSSKLMMAAKIDFYSKRDESEKLKKEINEELKNI